MAVQDDDSSATTVAGGFDAWWVLIPLAALSIPILAVSPVMAVGLIALVVIAAGTVATKVLMNHRHNLRLHELGMQQKIAELEASQLESANRVIEQNARLQDLRDAVSVKHEQSQPVVETNDSESAD